MRKNQIEGLLDTISEVACRYFVNLFSTNGVDDIDQILEQVPTYVTKDMNAALMEPVSDKEILDALG